MDPRIVFREPRVFFEIWYITVITKLLPNKPQPNNNTDVDFVDFLC